MSLAVGARLSAYEIVALIGAGGMGEVFLYVRSFPGPGREARITRTRATGPVWAPMAARCCSLTGKVSYAFAGGYDR